MKVLLATNQLRERAGSELYVTELAASLKERGASVAVFTFFPGELSRRFEAVSGIRVFGPDDVLNLKRLAPDIIHSHHVTTFHLMTELFPTVPKVHGLLGVLPYLEQAPCSIAEAKRVFAVSERVRDMAIARAARDMPIEIVRNWFDERELVEVPVFLSASDARQKVLVVSNNASPDIDRALTSLSDEGFVAFERVGAGRGARDITAEFLHEFDAIVTIGRTVLLAAATGVPCIVADQHLSDGLLTHDVVDDLAKHNFTGRTYRHSITAEHLRAEILRSKCIDRDALATKVRSEYGLSARSRCFLSVYDDVLQSTAGPATPPARRRGEGMAYLELARRTLDLEAQLARAKADARLPAPAAAPQPAPAVAQQPAPLRRSALRRAIGFIRRLRPKRATT